MDNWLGYATAILWITIVLIFTIADYKERVKQRNRLQKLYAEQYALVFKYDWWFSQYKKSIKYGAPRDFQMYCYKKADYYQTFITVESATTNFGGIKWT